MTDRPVKGDVPDEEPIPEHLRKKVKQDQVQDKDNPGSALESGDKQPE